MATKKEQMEQLINSLNLATKAYDEGMPYLSDYEWDQMYFKLQVLEKETGVVLPNSPTSTIVFETVSELKKKTHNHDMLSLDKTKDINTIKTFLKGKEWIVMSKMDGLTCSLRYLNGKLVSAETRGDGKIGEDILHNAKIISSIPKTIDFKDELIVDGEIICTYTDFKEFQDIYKNPRNFASGSIRLLNSKECYNRHLTFIAWDIILGNKYPYLSNGLTWLATLGFKIVPFFINDSKDDDSIEDYINTIRKLANKLSYPIDGVVFKYDKIEEYNAAGRTDHHFKGGLAFKFYDETVSSHLQNIEWTMGRTGVLTPVAIYDDIDIDGSICNRASLHNISIMRQILGKPYKNQEIKVAKMNQIIPQIIEAQCPKMDMYPYFFQIPDICPYCGASTEIKKDADSEKLYCTNLSCTGQLINRLDHFCGKKGLDIKGLSKMTLEKLINWNWINDLTDIFQLKLYKSDWIKKPGFGIASVDKILTAIEQARNCSADKFICAIGIPLIGKVASTALIKNFGSYNNFREAIENKNERLYQIDGIGEVMIDNLLKFDYNEADKIFNNFIIEAAATSKNGTELEGKTFVITGKLHLYKNREELKNIIELKGGKVTGSVTTKTNYLINNDTMSTSAKNMTAKKLHIPIINEDEFQTLLECDISHAPSYLASAT